MQHRMSVDKAKVNIVTLKRRDEDLDTLFKRIYEDMVSGRLSAERFDKLSTEYEEEQRQVKQTIVELQTLIDNSEQNEVDLQKFLRNVRKYTDPKELTAEILNDLVDKIVIYVPTRVAVTENKRLKFTTRLLELSMLPMRNTLPSMADSVCKTERRKQPDNAKRRHSFRCTATLHKYFVIAPRHKRRFYFFTLILRKYYIFVKSLLRY